MAVNKNQRQFTCTTCADSKMVPFDEFKAHLMEVHHCSADIKGNREMILHMDGADWFASTYKWALENGVTFTEFQQSPRRKNDPMRFNNQKAIKPAMSLTNIIADLIAVSEAAPGKPQSQTLGKGLKLELTTAALEYALELSREKVYPSAAELKAVLDAWPPPRPHGTAKQIRYKGRYILALVIERHVQSIPVGAAPPFPFGRR